MDKSSEFGINGGTSPASSDLTKPATESRFPLSNQEGDGSQVQNNLSNPTPASLTTAPQGDITSTDQAVPDSVRIDPQQPPKIIHLDQRVNQSQKLIFILTKNLTRTMTIRNRFN